MLNLEHTLVVIAVIHAYVFTILLLNDKAKSRKILGVYMLFIFFDYAINANMYLFRLPKLNYLFYYFGSVSPLFTMPLMYIYVKYMASETFVVSKKLLFHFLPAFLWFGLVMVNLFSIPVEIRHQIFQGVLKNSPYIENLRWLFYWSDWIIFLQLFFYSFKMLRQLVMHKYSLEKIYSFKEKISLNWLIAFVIIFFLYYSFEFYVFLSSDLPVDTSLYFLAITFHVFFIGIMGMRQREIYPKPNGSDSDSEPMPISFKELESEEPQKSEIKAPIIPDETKRLLAEKVRQIMVEKELYLNSELSLFDLASELNIHKNTLSYLINDEFGVNFYTFINSYRIEAVKKMLVDPSFNHISIEGMAQSVGFKSRTVFYPVFKKIVGKTPLQFKQDYNKETN